MAAVLWMISYLYRNIRISFSTAQAAIEAIAPAPNSQTEKNQTTSAKSFSQNRQLSSKSPLRKPTELSFDQKMVALIQNNKLCEFLRISKNENLSEKQKLGYLSDSFNALLGDLFPFIENDIEKTFSYRFMHSKVYAIGKSLNAFGKYKNKKPEDYSKGLSEEDKKILAAIDEAQKWESTNLFLTFLKIRLYRNYSNLPESLQESLYNEVMGADHFANRAFGLVKSLYENSLRNATQFYLAREILKKDVATNRQFMMVGAWFFPSIEVRSHVAEILGRHIDKIQRPKSAFGYDPGVYQGYRSILPFDEYFALSPLEEFDRTLSQPTYNIDELDIDMTGGCTQNKVDELSIKLRAM